jgi:hypothetical protein
MSKSDEFRQYAEEAMHWAYTAKSEAEKAMYLELARTWLTAAARWDAIERGRPI